MLCQEDILLEMSDEEREEYMQQESLKPPVHQRSQSQSVFVFGSFAAAAESQPKETNQKLADSTIE